MTEHAVLADKGKIQMDHFHFGCTCLSHMILYYETKRDIQWLDKVKQRMRDGTIISRKDVEKAKREVIEESQILTLKTQEREKIVRFVTEDRIKHFAMGIPSEIMKIRYQDVLNYWKYLNCNHHIYEIQFKDKNDVETIFQEMIKSVRNRNNQFAYKFNRNNSGDEYLILSQEEKCMLKIYFQIPPLREKEDYVTLAFLEYYVQELIEQFLHIDVCIEEKFFSKSEKYVLMIIPSVSQSEIRTLIPNIRSCIEKNACLAEMQLLYPEFINNISRAMGQEDVYDSLNKYQNWLLFDKPIFCREDIDKISRPDSKIFEGIQYILNEGVKAVITTAAATT